MSYFHTTRHNRRLHFAALAIISLALLLSNPARAQQGTGNIAGTVRDSSGAVIADAAVDILNVDRNTVEHLRTNGSGFFNSPPLTLGNNYRVTVRTQGFPETTLTGVAVTVGGHTQADVVLKIGTVEASVQVNTTNVGLDTTSATLGVVMGEKSIQDLPLNGRNTIALTTLTPGVRLNTTIAQSGFASRGLFLSAISINGSPTGSNAFILDGQNNLAARTGEIGINPTVDAIQEFKVQSGVFSAQYGFTLGGVVNLVSRSGTDAFHGSVYEFLRNDALNARNAFADAGVAKPEMRYNQYGGALGGPVKRGRAFFFGNYEEYRLIQGNPQFLSVPTDAQRAGNFLGLADATGKLIQLYDPYSTVISGTGVATRTPLSNNQITNFDPVSLKYQDLFYPHANHAPTNIYTNANNYLFVQRTQNNMRQALGRMDYKLTSADTVFGRYAYYNAYTNNGATGGTYYPNPVVANRFDTFNIQSLIVGDTHVFSSSLINDFRIAVTRQVLLFQAGSTGMKIPEELGLPSNVPDLALPTVGNGLPGSSQTVGSRGYTNPQITETLTKVVGHHVLTFGTDLRDNIGANLQHNNPSGNFSFAAMLTSDPSGNAAPAGYTNAGNTYATFLQGPVSSASLETVTGSTDRSWSASFFAQDDWQVSPRLSLNLGLRYDFQAQPYEQNNEYSNFNPSLSSGGFLGIMQYANHDGVGRNFLQENYLDFGPRVGFALRVTNDGKTILRGGFGIYYPSTFNSLYEGLTSGFATTNTTYSPPGGDTRLVAFKFQNGFPSAPINPIGAGLGPLGFLGQGVGYIPTERTQTPQSQQYTLSLERQLPYSVVVQAAYVGNHGVHLVAGTYNTNQLNPSYFSLGTTALAKTKVMNPYAGSVPGSLGTATITRQQALLPFPYYAAVTATNPHDGNMIAHYLELSAQRQSGKGLTLLFGYTAGKLLSDSVGSPLAYLNSIAGTTGYQNVYDRHSEYSLDPSDVSQRATISALYNLPFGANTRFASHSSFVNHLVEGFQINLIGVMQTGIPLAINGGNAYTATRPNYTPGQSVAVKQQSAQQWFNPFAFENPSDFTFGNVPRTLPHVRAPGTETFDLSLFKTTEIGPRLKLQLRAEAFNVLNHVNYGQPNTSFTAAANPIVGPTGVASPCVVTRGSNGVMSGTGGCNTNGSFGTITSAADARAIQLAAKFIF